MKHTNLPTDEINRLLNQCLQEKQHLADVLQDDINQILASVLLWIECTKLEHNLADNLPIEKAETNLRLAIDRVREMHYALSKEIPE